MQMLINNYCCDVLFFDEYLNALPPTMTVVDSISNRTATASFILQRTRQHVMTRNAFDSAHATTEQRDPAWTLPVWHWPHRSWRLCVKTVWAWI